MRGKRKAKLFVAIVRPEPKRFRPKIWNAIPPRGAVHKIEPVPTSRLGHAIVMAFNNLPLNTKPRASDRRWATRPVSATHYIIRQGCRYRSCEIMRTMGERTLLGQDVA